MYMDQEVNLDLENVNYSGHWRATGEFDGSNDLYKMTSIARFVQCFAVNEDGSPSAENSREWNPESLRKRQELTGNNKYRVFIHGGSMFWSRFNLTQPEVVFSGRPTFIYGSASYGESRILNPVFADYLGAVVSKSGATFAFSHGQKVNLSNFLLEGPLNLSGKAEVVIDNMQTSPIVDKPGEFYGITINNDLPAQGATKVDDRNLVITGKNGAVGIRVVGDAYRDENLTINLNNWTLKPSPFNKTGFTGNKKGSGKSKISINQTGYQL